jgi:hypothetical protein
MVSIISITYLLRMLLEQYCDARCKAVCPLVSALFRSSRFRCGDNSSSDISICLSRKQGLNDFNSEIPNSKHFIIVIRKKNLNDLDQRILISHPTAELA